MGVLDFLGSVASGIGKLASGLVRTAASVIKTGAELAVRGFKHIAGAIGGNAGKIFGAAARLLGAAISVVTTGPLGPILGPIVVQIIIEVAAQVVAKIAKSLGIIKEEDKVEEVGYRLEEACAVDEQGDLKHPDWKRMEDFDNMRDYYAYLKVMIPDEAIDYGKLKKNRLNYVALGTTGLTEGWGKIAGIQIPEDFILNIGQANLRQGEVQAVIDAFKALGFTSIRFKDFLTAKNLTMDEVDRLRDVLIAAYQDIYPDKSRADVLLRLHEWRQAVTDDRVVYETYKDRVDSVMDQADRGVAVEDIDFHSEPSYTKDMR